MRTGLLVPTLRQRANRRCCRGDQLAGDPAPTGGVEGWMAGRECGGGGGRDWPEAGVAADDRAGCGPSWAAPSGGVVPWGGGTDQRDGADIMKETDIKKLWCVANVRAQTSDNVASSPHSDYRLAQHSNTGVGSLASRLSWPPRTAAGRPDPRLGFYRRWRSAAAEFFPSLWLCIFTSSNLKGQGRPRQGWETGRPRRGRG